MRFRLRSLLLLVGVVAAYFGVAKTAGYGVAAGIVVVVLAMATMLLLRQTWATYVRIPAILAGFFAIWMLAVDRSDFIDECPDCGSYRSFTQWRVLGIPCKTWSREGDPSGWELALRDMGVPCLHRQRQPWHKVRLWGLWFCCCPCHNGIFRLTGDDDRYYMSKLSAEFQRIGREDPELARELHRRVVEEHDYDYFMSFYTSVAAKAEWNEN